MLWLPGRAGSGTEGGQWLSPTAPHVLPGRGSPLRLQLQPEAGLQQGRVVPAVHPSPPCPICPKGARRQAGLRAGAVSSLSPPLSLPGLHVLAIAFTLEVSVGKTNTVMALNNSNVLLPCTFTTCIGFQDLVFTWYFNSTEMVGGSRGFVSLFLADPFVLSRCRPALQCSWSSLSPLAGWPPSECLQLWGRQGCANRVTQIPWHVCAFGTKLVWSFCCPQAHFLPQIGHKLAVRVRGCALGNT